ncbi:hypothetical protein Bhyg_06222 [Pseudolycoriella hygida]|uniref:Uncharacterized protein n=1 Tax=Pseudolycoriella hygida TaxID=35572 RepID=A0A9Q0N1V5_9DIPT|nr:hypothetical protein Bhyg_06222 [Pseudolycoriella hygida]
MALPSSDTMLPMHSIRSFNEILGDKLDMNLSLPSREQHSKRKRDDGNESQPPIDPNGQAKSVGTPEKMHISSTRVASKIDSTSRNSFVIN